MNSEDQCQKEYDPNYQNEIDGENYDKRSSNCNINMNE